MVEMEKKADVRSDCREENEGVKIRGGEREGGQTMSSG